MILMWILFKKENYSFLLEMLFNFVDFLCKVHTTH